VATCIREPLTLLCVVRPLKVTLKPITRRRTAGRTWSKSNPANVGTDRNLEEEIRRRAYALYEQRGREDGHDLDDWLHAEAELTAQAMKTAA